MRERITKGAQEGAVGSVSLKEGGLDAEVGIEDVAPFASDEVKCALALSCLKVSLDLIYCQGSVTTL